MNVKEIFDKHVDQYENWFIQHPFVFQSELEAIRSMLPYGEILGIEVGLATGRFSKALGIKEGVEPSSEMRKRAISKGIHVFDAVAESLPFKDMKYDFVLMNNCIVYFENCISALKEAYRVLKRGGTIIVSFIDVNSTIGKEYESVKGTSTFYKQARFYEVEEIKSLLLKSGFSSLKISQTLFGSLDEIQSIQPSIPGYGVGSFVVISGVK